MTDDEHSFEHDSRATYLAPELIPQHALSGALRSLTLFNTDRNLISQAFEPDYR